MQLTDSLNHWVTMPMKIMERSKEEYDVLTSSHSFLDYIAKSQLLQDMRMRSDCNGWV